MLVLLLILTRHQAFWKEKEIHPVLKLEKTLRIGSLVRGRSLNLSTSGIESLGSKWPPHVRDKDHCVPKKLDPLAVSQFLPMSSATSYESVGCSWDPCKETEFALIYLL